MPCLKNVVFRGLASFFKKFYVVWKGEVGNEFHRWNYRKIRTKPSKLNKDIDLIIDKKM